MVTYNNALETNRIVYSHLRRVSQANIMSILSRKQRAFVSKAFQETGTELRLHLHVLNGYDYHQMQL